MSKRKRSKIKRSHLKYFSVPQAKQPNPAKLAEYHAAVASTTGPRNSMLPLLNSTWMQDVPATIPTNHQPISKDKYEDGTYVSPEDKAGGTVKEGARWTPRRAAQEVKLDYVKWASARFQGFDNWMWFKVSEAIGSKIFLGSHGPAWKFVKIIPSEGEIFESITYNSKDLAMLAFRAVRIAWVNSASKKRNT